MQGSVHDGWLLLVVLVRGAVGPRVLAVVVAAAHVRTRITLAHRAGWVRGRDVAMRRRVQ